ncbi:MULTISPECIES: hypothetical protein [unclassified Luteibacter]|uniref:hypothetical protein n=1 Tax=Luteibacter sp. PvP019 TaxID=3156436 RepID=UPI003395A52D
MAIMNDQASYGSSNVQSRDDARATYSLSPALSLNVSKPGNQDARLPRPAVADADGDQLDLNAFAGDTTITCVPWPLIAIGQKVWLAVDGTLDDGTTTTLRLWTGSPVVASEIGNGLSKTLSRTWLKSLRNDSSITVRLNVTFDESTHEARSVAFRVRTLAVRVSEFNLVDNFDKYALGMITNRTPLDFLRYEGDSPSNWSVVTAPSGMSGRCLRVFTSSPPSGPYSYLHYTTEYYPLPVSIMEFTYIAMSGANSGLPFYIRAGSVQQTHWLIVDKQPHTLRIEIPSTVQYSFGFGGTPTGPGTLDVYVDNLKIKTP